MNENETVTVGRRLKKRRVLKMSLNKSSSDGKTIPAIRFSGDYLRDLGFKIGGFFEMTINEDHTLSLKPIDDEVQNGKSVQEVDES